MRTRFFSLVALLLVSDQVAADERSFRFGGSLESDAGCPRPNKAFCGQYSGTLTIDDDQEAAEWIPGHAYYYRYTVAEVIFADGQAVISRSPSQLPTRQSAIMGTIPKLRVETSGDYISITIDIVDPTSAFGSIAARYYYDRDTVVPADLRDVLETLSKEPEIAKFFVVGGACSWGPCVDSSLTPLRPSAPVENDG